MKIEQFCFLIEKSQNKIFKIMTMFSNRPRLFGGEHLADSPLPESWIFALRIVTLSSKHVCHDGCYNPRSPPFRASLSGTSHHDSGLHIIVIVDSGLSLYSPLLFSLPPRFILVSCGLWICHPSWYSDEIHWDWCLELRRWVSEPGEKTSALLSGE